MRTHATAWKNLEDMVLSDRGQSRKDRCSSSICMRCLEHPHVGTESRVVAPGDWGLWEEMS
jgi:hypothetical protein